MDMKLAGQVSGETVLYWTKEIWGPKPEVKDWPFHGDGQESKPTNRTPGEKKRNV